MSSPTQKVKSRMLTVRTYLGPSAINGIGLFAAEPISAGSVVWIRHKLDIAISDADLADLPAPALHQVAHHTYRDIVTGERILCGDNARFMNHSDDPNTGQLNPDVEIALRDIEVGEELTCNYRTFDADSVNFLPFTPEGELVAPPGIEIVYTDKNEAVG